MRKITVLALSLLAATTAPAQSTFHGNVQRTGAYEKPGPTRFGGVKWAFKAGGAIVTSPAVAGDLVYVGNHNGKLYAISASTGKLVWEFQTDASKADPMKVLNPDGSLNQDAFAPVFNDFEDMYLDFYRFVSIGAIMSSPVLDRGVVYLGSLDGKLYAIQ